MERSFQCAAAMPEGGPEKKNPSCTGQKGLF
jgi:hypothetical protein